MNRLSLPALRLLLLSVLLLPTGVRTRAQGMQAPTHIIHLYPDGQRSGHGIIEDGIAVTQGPGVVTRPDTTEFYWERDGSLNAVSDSARIVLYLPSKCNGQLILVCPGGGYNELMYRSEGTYAAYHLTQRGYAVGIVCYRMPFGCGDAPLTDVQNAFRYCRHHAPDWGIRQIGIMGMSAGGHLAACASTMFVDAATRPDFAILFYPVTSCDGPLIHRGSYRRLTGLSPELISQAALLQDPLSPEVLEARARIERYTPLCHVDGNTPPTLLFHSADDRGVPYRNSVLYFQALRAQGVEAELHIFPSGGHGWGFNTLQTAGRDKIEPYREAFFRAIEGFLQGRKID